MSAKVSIDFSKFQAKFKKIGNLVASKPLIDEVGKISIKRIQGVTRSGKNIEGGSQPGLASTTKITRGNLAKNNSTHPTYSKGRSNLTFSGQLLDSLTFKKISGGLRIEPSGSRKPYKGAKNAPSNKELAGYLSAQGRTFLGIDKTLVNQIKSTIKSFLRRKLRR